VDNSGQGEGLVAYIRLWSWYNSNSHERKYEYRQQVLSPDRCKAVSGVADAIERWESRLASVQQADDSFTCAEGWKIALLRKILPESLDKEVALRTSEFGDSYDKMRSFIMKYALQERAQAQSSKAMDTSVVSRADSDSMWDTYCKNVGWVEEVDYTQAYYDDPWDVPASTGPQYDAYGLQWDVDAVAFGKSKGKGKPKGYQSKGYQPSSAKGSKGFDNGERWERWERWTGWKRQVQ